MILITFTILFGDVNSPSHHNMVFLHCKVKNNNVFNLIKYLYVYIHFLG